MSVVELFFLASFGYFEMWFGMVCGNLYKIINCKYSYGKVLVVYFSHIFIQLSSIFILFHFKSSKTKKKKPFGGIVVIFFIKNKKHSYFESTIKTVSHKTHSAVRNYELKTTFNGMGNKKKMYIYKILHRVHSLFFRKLYSCKMFTYVLRKKNEPNFHRLSFRPKENMTSLL